LTEQGDIRILPTYDPPLRTAELAGGSQNPSVPATTATPAGTPQTTPVGEVGRGIGGIDGFFIARLTRSRA
ncbi:MAG: hypothetical protein AAFO75_13555, partial [Pseudomonadota bacterium]